MSEDYQRAPGRETAKYRKRRGPSQREAMTTSTPRWPSDEEGRPSEAVCTGCAPGGGRSAFLKVP
jgi:hypothetical protein